MPHAWPTPVIAAGLVSEADVRSQQTRMVELPGLYARSLRVPVVFVNQVGPLLPIGGILGRLMDPHVWRLRGQSRVVDSDGRELGWLGDEEGVLVVAATPERGRGRWVEPPSHAGWLQPGAAQARRVFIPLDILTGSLSYSISRQRRRKAAAAATAAPGPSLHRGHARPADVRHSRQRRVADRPC